MSVSIECPGCLKTYEIPAKAVGKKVKCACGESFIAEEPLPEEERWPFAGLSESEEPPTLPSLPVRKPDPASAEANPRDTSSDDGAPQSQYPTNFDRYPNLKRYLSWAAFLAKIQFRVAIFLSVLSWMVGLALVVLFTPNTPLFHTMEGYVQVALFLASVSVSSGLLALLSWIVYYGIMSAVEFVYVIVDIENNTRIKIAS